MIVVALDTNFVLPRVFHNSRNPEINVLDRMLFLEAKGMLKISFDKTTQAELYAILKVGRVKIRNPISDKKEKKKFPHHVIMQFVHRYKDLFDVEFMESLNKVDFGEEEKYKDNLFTEVKYALNMSIGQTKEYLENKGIDLSSCNDQYDFYVMATVLQDSADYLVTQNIKDFPNPIGKCIVVDSKGISEHLPLYP